MDRVFDASLHQPSAAGYRFEWYWRTLLTIQFTLATTLTHRAEAAIAKLLDPDEKVRAVACQALGTLDTDTILQYVDVGVLEQLGHRCRDKKVGWLCSKRRAYSLFAIARNRLLQESRH